jgi:hypothetical protein
LTEDRNSLDVTGVHEAVLIVGSTPVVSRDETVLLAQVDEELIGTCVFLVYAVDVEG